MSKREYEVPPDYLVLDRDPPIAGYLLTWDAVAGETWQAPTGAGSMFVHIQSTPSQLWTVNHNFGRPPMGIMVFNDAVEEMFGDEAFVTANTMTIAFSAPTTGVARMV